MSKCVLEAKDVLKDSISTLKVFEIENSNKPYSNHFSVKVINNCKLLNANSKFLDRFAYTCSGTSPPTLKIFLGICNFYFGWLHAEPNFGDQNLGILEYHPIETLGSRKLANTHVKVWVVWQYTQLMVWVVWQNTQDFSLPKWSIGYTVKLPKPNMLKFW